MENQELDEKNLKALVSLLADEDVEILRHVRDKIISLGEPLIPFLEQEWESNFNPLVQKRIIEIIHRVQFSSLKNRLKVWKDSTEQDLIEALWLIATYQYPDLDKNKVKAELEQIFYEVWPDMQEEMRPMDAVKVINNVLFNKLKFSANTKNFHSPSNSMINSVLESRKGNPISLCLVYMLVAQKLKLPVYGVNLPNLFILTYKTDKEQFYINAFNKGLIFSKADIDNYLSHLSLSPNPVFYEPCTHVDIVARIFRNLIASFEKISELEKAKEVKQLLEIIESN